MGAAAYRAGTWPDQLLVSDAKDGVDLAERLLRVSEPREFSRRSLASVSALSVAALPDLSRASRTADDTAHFSSCACSLRTTCLWNSLSTTEHGDQGPVRPP